MGKMIVLAFTLIAGGGCSHNMGGNFTGLLISQGGLVFGTGTFAIVKENATQNYEAGTDTTRMKYNLSIGAQTSGYDVELAKVITTDSTIKVK